MQLKVPGTCSTASTVLNLTSNRIKIPLFIVGKPILFQLKGLQLVLAKFCLWAHVDCLLGYQIAQGNRPPVIEGNSFGTANLLSK